nr:hypothetical protein [Tanacetum cinerariifolium]
MMSSPTLPTTDVKDAFSSSFSDYTTALPNYFPASPRNISPDPPDNLSKYLFASLAISPFHDMQAYNVVANKPPIPLQDPITPPTILTPSPILPPSLLFDPWIQTLVDGKRVNIKESFIRRTLRLDDAKAEQNLPSPSNDPLPSGEDSLKLKELMDLCTNLSNKVLELESEVIDIKSTYQKRIEKIEGGVERLEEENKVIKNLRNLDHQEKVISMMDVNEEESADVEEVLEVVKAAKLMTEVVTIAGATKVSVLRKRRGVIIQDPEEATTATVQPKIEEETKELKKHLQIVNNDDDVYPDATPLALKIPIVDYKIHTERNRPYFKIIRADGNHMLFISLSTMLKNFDRECLESRWKIVRDRFKKTMPKNYLNNYLLNTLKIMFKKPIIEASVWKDQKGRHGLAKRMYLLTHFILEQMVNDVRLQVEDESQMSLKLLRLVKRQLNEGKICYKRFFIRAFKTSNTLHNAIMEAGGKDHPPMLAPDNDINSTVDACPNACEMWKSIERLKQGESINVQDLETNLYWKFGKFTSRDGESLESYYLRFYQMMNELVRNKCDVTNQQVNVQFLLNLQQKRQRSQQAATRNSGKAIVNSPIPIYDQEPPMVVEDDEMSKDNEIDKHMALISLSFKKIYIPTNNNLRTSSNTSRANQDNSPRINRGAGYDNQRLGNVAGARETVAYHREKMLLYKQEEAGIQLNAVQADWRDDTDDESEDQELEAHYMYMAQMQEVSPDVANFRPIFDSKPVQQ